MEASLFDDLPNLAANHEEKSEYDDAYNCIAFSVGDCKRWWEPYPEYWDAMDLLPPSPKLFWPPGIPRESTVKAWVALYEELTYEVCGSGELETGFEKVAIYGL